MARRPPPPCNSDEVPWDGKCYPRVDTFRVFKAGPSYTFEIDGASPDTFPLLHGLSGDDAEITLKKVGATVNVTITSVPHEDAAKLLEKLDPDGLGPKLPN